MTTTRFFAAALAGAAFLSLRHAATVVAQEPAQKGLSVAEFEKLHKELSCSREPWQEIPWQLSILEARARAAKEKKPVYLLVRSGHPLGCV